MDDNKIYNKMSHKSEILIKEWSLENDVKGIINATKYLDDEIAK